MVRRKIIKIDESKCNGCGNCIIIGGKEAYEPPAMVACSISQEMAATGQGRRLHKLGPSSQLSSWPIKMLLAHVDDPHFKDSSLLIAADCSAFASPSVPEFVKGRVVLIGCPKLEQTGPFVEMLTDILRNNHIKDIAVLHMEVPCCSHLARLASEALKRSGRQVPVSRYVCKMDGGIKRAKNGRALS